MAAFRSKEVPPMEGDATHAAACSVANATGA
jgi:hypothetical protein